MTFADRDKILLQGPALARLTDEEFFGRALSDEPVLPGFELGLRALRCG